MESAQKVRADICVSTFNLIAVKAIMVDEGEIKFWL